MAAGITAQQAAALAGAGISPGVVRQLDLLEAFRDLFARLFGVIKEWALEEIEQLVKDAPDLITMLVTALGNRVKDGAGDVLEDAQHAIEDATGVDWDGDGSVGSQEPE